MNFLINIPMDEYKDLLKNLKESEEERAVLKASVIKIMELMGLIDPATGKMKEEIASGEESFIPGMLKALSDVVSLLTKSSVPSWMGGGAKAKKQLADKFDFIAPLLPIINKYKSEANER